MCWPQRVPRSVQLQHPHSVNKPNTTGNQLQLLHLPPAPPGDPLCLQYYPSVGWHCWQCFIHAIYETLCTSILPPALLYTHACTLCSPVYLWTALRFFNCNLSCPFATTSLHFASLWLAFFTFFSSSLCASLLHFIWLACNLFLAAFCWPFIMLCYLAVNLCPLHVAKFRDRSNKLGNSASLMYFHFDSIFFCLCVTISRVSQCV